MKEIAKSHANITVKQQAIKANLKNQINELIMKGTAIEDDKLKTQLQNIIDGKNSIRKKNKKISVNNLAASFADMKTFSQAQDDFSDFIDALLELKNYNKDDDNQLKEKGMISAFAYLKGAEE